MFIGWLGDRLASRQKSYLGGLLVVGAATLLFALGRTVAILLVARLLQGFSSAIVFTIGCALLLDAVGQESIGQAMGYTGVGLTLGVLLGPIVGGFLYQWGGYFQVFVPTFVLIGIEIILRFMVVTAKHRTAETGSRASSNPVLEQVNRTSVTYGTTDTDVACLNGSSGMDEATAKDSNLLEDSDPEDKPRAVEQTRTALVVMLSSPRFLIAVGALGTLNGFTGAFDAVLPPYVRELLGLDAIQASLLFLTMSLPSLLAPLAGALADRCGSKWPAAGALALMAASLTLLGLVQNKDGSTIIILVILLTGFGLSLTFAMAPLMAEVSSAVDEIERRRPGVFGSKIPYEQAYGVMNASFAAGAMVGPLVSDHSHLLVKATRI